MPEKRREVKGRGEKERYIHLNSEFQRIARKDKEAFLSDQYKEIGKQQNGKDQRSLSCKDGHNKGQNGMNLTETGDIKKRWQEYTEELYKKRSQSPR